MVTSNNLSLTLVETAQAQKEITVNQALMRIDAVLNMGAKDKDIATPPGAPGAGDTYIIAPSPTGDWTGKAGQIAYYEQIWRFIVPKEGMRLFVSDENSTYVYDGSIWKTEESQLSTVMVIASSGSSYTLDYAQGSTQDLTLTASSVTLSISNPPDSGKLCKFTLYLRQDGTGSRTVTWPLSVKWPSASAPTLTAIANRLDIIELSTINGGTSWQGRVVAQNFA